MMDEVVREQILKKVDGIKERRKKLKLLPQGSTLNIDQIDSSEFTFNDKIKENIKNVTIKVVDQKESQTIEKAKRKVKLIDRKQLVLDETRQRKLDYLSKWDKFRATRDTVINDYIKVRSKMGAVTQILVLCTAEQIIKKVSTVYRDKVNAFYLRNKMHFMVRCGLRRV